MAKQRFGINDAYRGSVGTVIGYQWRGQWCLRAKPRFVKNPRTEAQQRNRELFKQAVRFAGDLRIALLYGMREKALEAHMTDCNYFYHKNKDCFALKEGRLVVDYAGLRVSDGPVAPVGFDTPAVEGREVTLAFEKKPLHMRAGFDDEVRLMALCPEENEMMMSGSVPRRGKSISIMLPAHWEGRELHLYGFVTDYVGRASASTYIGMLMDGADDERELDRTEELALEDVASDNAVVGVAGSLEGGAVAHNKLGIRSHHVLGAPHDGGDELRE
jgi:hypothetical protein